MSSIPIHVSFDFVTMSVDNKIAFGLIVPPKLTAAATTFPNCTVVPADLTTLNTNLNVANVNFNNNPLLLDALQNAETLWIAGFSKDANYVDSIANGNGATIDLSGYHKTRDTRVPAALPAEPVVKSSKSNSVGGLDTFIATQADAKTFLTAVYTHDITVTFSGNQILFTKLNEDGSTTQASVMIAKKRRANFEGLKSKSDMKSQSTAINAKGMSRPTRPTDNGIL